MSYVQGTKVRVIADFLDVNDQAVTGLDEVTLTIERPDGTTEVRTLTGNGVQPDPLVPGRFYSVIDTASAPGVWQYQFENPGAEQTVKRKQLTVKQRLPSPP
jgi:hypothetical protein